MSELNLIQKAPRNIIWNFIGQGWLIFFALIATPFIVHRLDVSLYGIYVLISVVIDYFAFLQLGMGAAAIKYIAQFLAREDHDSVRLTFWTGMISHFITGLLGMTLIIASAGFFVDNVFNISHQFRDTALFALRIGSVGFLLSLLSGMAAGVIRALGRFDILNIMGIVFGTLQMASTIVVLLIGLSLKEIIIANLAVQFAGLSGYWYYGIRLAPYLKIRAWSGKMMLQMLKFGGFVTLSGLVGPILTNIEKIFLTALRSVSDLTYYAVPFSLVNRLSVIPSSFSAVLFPLFSFYQDSSGSAVNKEIHDRSVLYLCLIYAVPILFILFFGRDFLSWWVGDDFAERSTAILIVLSLAGIANAAAYPSITALQGMGKPQWPAMFHVLETFFYIPAGYLMIREFGGLGAAMAWLSRILLDTLLLHGAAARFFGESLMRWYLKLLYRVLPPVILITFLFWILRNLNMKFLSFWNFLGICTGIFAYGYVLWRWVLDEPVRSGLVRLIKRQ